MCAFSTNPPQSYLFIPISLWAFHFSVVCHQVAVVEASKCRREPGKEKKHFLFALIGSGLHDSVECARFKSRPLCVSIRSTPSKKCIHTHPSRHKLFHHHVAPTFILCALSPFLPANNKHKLLPPLPTPYKRCWTVGRKQKRSFSCIAPEIAQLNLERCSVDNPPGKKINILNRFSTERFVFQLLFNDKHSSWKRSFFFFLKKKGGGIHGNDTCSVV